MVFYSLGNFIFDQYFNQDVRQGLILKLIENSKFELELNLIPVISEETLAQPTLMNDTDRKLFLNKLSEYSSSDVKEFIKSAKVNLNNQLATSTETAIIAE